MSGLPRCSSCGAFMEWVVMRDGRRIPLDLAPSAEQGTVWIDPQGRGVFLKVEDRARAVQKGETLRVVHHQTCPSVGRHRVPRAQMALDL